MLRGAGTVRCVYVSERNGLDEQRVSGLREDPAREGFFCVSLYYVPYMIFSMRTLSFEGTDFEYTCFTFVGDTIFDDFKRKCHFKNVCVQALQKVVI